MIIKKQKLKKEVMRGLSDSSNALKFSVFLIFAFISATCSMKNKRESRHEADSVDSRRKMSNRTKEDIIINLKNLHEAVKDSNETKSFILTQYLKDTLPDKLFLLKNLENLTVNFTYIEKIPNEICRLKNLKSLNLSANKLSDVSSLSCLEKLESLDLSQNKLTSTADLKNLYNLSYLNISHNDFSDGVGSKFPENILELNLSNARLKSIPNEISTLQNLNRLVIRENPEIKSMHKGIIQLKELKEVVLYGTSIETDTLTRYEQLMPWCSFRY